MSDTIVPFDLMRMLWGDAPPGYLAEILVRTLIVYTYSLLLVRWVGGRGVAQLSLVEFLLVIALGSAVGDSLFYPDVPLLHALLTITVVILINKALDVAIVRWRGAKHVIDGHPVLLVRDGVIDPAIRHRRQLSDHEVMAMLRMNGVCNLGEVRAAYLESSGALSIFRHDRARPGLVIEPPHEIERPVRVRPRPGEPGKAVCVSCGSSGPASGDRCTVCGCQDFTAPS
jgi:uncharacterized membrane protein YcaP (DUF421 family)